MRLTAVAAPFLLVLAVVTPFVVAPGAYASQGRMVLELVLLVVAAAGSLAAWRTIHHRGARTSYLAGMVVFLLGLLSFRIFDEPTTINIGGAAAVFLGLAMACAAALWWFPTHAHGTEGARGALRE